MITPTPITGTAVPRTFWSEQQLAAAVDAAFVDALVQELAGALTDDAVTTAPAAIDLPDVDTLIAQAGILLGPCPPDPRRPSHAAHYARIAGPPAGRAAWWLLKTTAYLALAVVGCVLVTAWRLLIPGPQQPQPLNPATADPARTGRDVPTSTFLETTSSHLTEHGWIQGRLHTSAGMCVRGATRDLVAHGTGSRHTATRAEAYMRATVRTRSVPHWNDNLSRSEGQIHTALLKAAARARAAGD